VLFLLDFALMANILITGRLGYVGVHVLHLLVEHGHRPIVFNQFLALSPPSRPVHPSIIILEGDFANRSLLAKTLADFSIDAVVHNEEITDHEEVNSSPQNWYRTNVFDVFGLLEELAAFRPSQPPPVVMASTSEVFGDNGFVPISETTHKNPLSAYGRSKLAAEWILQDLGHCLHIPNVILRFFNPAGANLQHDIEAWLRPPINTIASAIRAVRSFKPFMIYGDDYPTKDGTIVRDFIHVTDLAIAHISAINYLLAGGSSTDFNLGSGQGHSVFDILHSVERITSTKAQTHLLPRCFSEPPVLTAEVSKAMRILEWNPESSSLDQMVMDSAAWDANFYSTPGFSSGPFSP
jgi:UDP-glucose-4-epimerase GalE